MKFFSVSAAVAFVVSGATAQVVPGTQVDPDQLGLASEKAAELRLALRAGDWPRAEALLFPSVQERPDSADLADLLEALGEMHFRAKRFLPAARAWKRADRMRPISEYHRFALATAYIALDRRHWARPELERLAEENPNNPAYPYWSALVFQHLQWFEEAIATARRALSVDPDYARAQQTLGECLESAGRYDEAAAAYRQAARAVEADARSRAWLSLGSLAHEQGELEEAEKRLRRAIREHSASADAHYELGLVLRKLSKIDEAVSLLQRAVRLDPVSAEKHYALGTTLRLAGDADGARKALQEFRRLQ